MTIRIRNKQQKVALITKLIVGTKQHFPSGSLDFGGTTYAVTTLETTLQSFVDMRAASDAATVQAKAKLAQEEALSPAILAVVSAYEAYLRARFGSAPDILADFGLEPRKVPTPRTAEEKAVAVEKSKATRKARNTMGSVQKKDVKGKVSVALVVTPEPAVAPPVPASNGGATATPPAHG